MGVGYPVIENGNEYPKTNGYDSEVIIMTGYHSYTNEDATRIGASDLIHKPAKLRDLLDSISRVLKNDTSISFE